MDPSAVIIVVGVLAVVIPLSLYGLRVGITPIDNPDPDLELVIERNVRVLAESARRMEATEQIIYGTRRYPRL